MTRTARSCARSWVRETWRSAERGATADMDLAKGEGFKGMAAGRAGWPTRFAPLIRPLGAVILVVGFVLWAHFGSGDREVSVASEVDARMAAVSRRLRARHLRRGRLLRARGPERLQPVLFHESIRAGASRARPRPTRSIPAPPATRPRTWPTLSSTPIASTPGWDERLSFEENVMRCYAGHMDGFVPTLYDPAIRDLRILARGVAHHLQLGEGARRGGG